MRVTRPHALPSLCLLSLTALGLAAAPSQAQLTQVGVSPNGTVLTLLGAPGVNNVNVGQNQSNTDPWWFKEQTTHVSSLFADIVNHGTYQSPGSLIGNGGTISGLVNSYMLYSDPVHSPTLFTADVKFSEKILGILVLQNRLDNTDTSLGLSTTSYPPHTNSARGLELSSTEDFLSWSGDTISIHNRTHGNVDEIRVLTDAIPEPAFYQMSALIGLGGLGLLRRRLRRR